jgi:hypothetical protein
MFPLTTFIVSFLVIVGMVIYRVDEIRLNDDPETIRKQFPEFRILHSVRNGVDTVIYVVGIRIYRLIRKIRKRLKK